MRIPHVLVAGLGLVLGAACGWGQESSLANPTKRRYKDEVVRLMTAAPGPPGSFIVREDGSEVPYQVEEIGGKSWIWVGADFEAGAAHQYQVAPGRPAPAKPKVAVRKEGAAYVLDNGLVAVKVPAEAAGGIPGPIAAVRIGDKWVGASVWRTSLALRKFTATVVGGGTVLGKVRLAYEFDGKAGLDGNTPAFAQVDVALGPGWSHAEVFERHEMARGDYWELDASKGWAPTQGVSKPFSGGAGSGLVGGKVEPDRPLKPGGLPYQREDLFINLFPRFEELRRAAEAKLKEDMYHSITLPGGAGQECPGYVGYALRNWTDLAAVCKQHLGFDPTTWDRFKAAQYFQKRITQGDVGLFVPDAGYPFGEIPDWLVRQRAKGPDGAK
jgi:hypothetical protein